jgi:hypothetical protein
MDSSTCRDRQHQERLPPNHNSTLANCGPQSTASLDPVMAWRRCDTRPAAPASQRYVVLGGRARNARERRYEDRPLCRLVQVPFLPGRITEHTRMVWRSRASQQKWRTVAVLSPRLAMPESIVQWIISSKACGGPSLSTLSN